MDISRASQARPSRATQSSAHPGSVSGVSCVRSARDVRGVRSVGGVGSAEINGTRSIRYGPFHATLSAPSVCVCVTLSTLPHACCVTCEKFLSGCFISWPASYFCSPSAPSPVAPPSAASSSPPLCSFYYLPFFSASSWLQFGYFTTFCMLPPLPALGLSLPFPSSCCSFSSPTCDITNDKKPCPFTCVRPALAPFFMAK